MRGATQLPMFLDAACTPKAGGERRREVVRLNFKWTGGHARIAAGGK